MYFSEFGHLVTLTFDQNKHKHFKILNKNKEIKINLFFDRPVGRVGEGFQGCPLPRRVRQGDALPQDGPARGPNSGRMIKQQTYAEEGKFLNMLVRAFSRI